MRKIFYVLILLISVISCSKDKYENNSSLILRRDFTFKVTNSNGSDLLNPLNFGSYPIDSVRIYYLTNGLLQEVYNPNSDNPGGVGLINPIDSKDTSYSIGLTLNYLPDTNAITFIKWNSNDIDTICSKLHSVNPYTGHPKVWYNGVLVLDEDSTNIPVIIK